MVGQEGEVKVSRHVFGESPDGQEVARYVLDNGLLRCAVLSYGAVIQSLEMKEDQGWHNVVLGFDDLPSYMERSPHFGGLCGRHAGRIRHGQFHIREQTFQLERNFRGKHNLHGGSKGLDRRIWQAEVVDEGLKLRYQSPHGENGFPGNVDVCVYYRLVGREIHHHYYATSDQPTPINLNNHSYFNLGEESTSIARHRLRMDANYYAPLDDEFLFTEARKPVRGSVFDFRSPALLGERLAAKHPQLELAGGFDHSFFLQPQNFWGIELSDEDSGRRLRIHTDQQVVVFYSGNSLTEQVNPLAEGRKTRKHGALCLETQDLPASFVRDSCRLTAPGSPYRALTIWRLDHVGQG